MSSDTATAEPRLDKPMAPARHATVMAGSDAIPPTPTPCAPHARIAPALMATWGKDDDDPDATRPAPLDDGHIDLPVDDESEEGDTVIELPLDELSDRAVHLPL